ncbi:DUF416 family protein [Sphingobium sp. HBC34]|uniref:DUF416 family protein n=1 Tax=Sphingobium cyanobacteriorum TaxID=3063954 RepID=A0ABT8ZIQ4_9SPHN|nr:DUF416 family protein [Sphingobium sp. HBC34]MDO7833665.1 DUF416 family protein [Sphingobium sp. HBC34]
MDLRFDEADLVEKLASLDERKVAAFAVVCAERLVRSGMEFADRSSTAGILANASEAIWQAIEVGDLRVVVSLEGQLLDVMPSEDDDGSFGAAVIEDACAALIYTARSLHEQAAQNAAWSARRAYETADRYASQLINATEYTDAAELQILSHPVVQQELRRQARDLGATIAVMREANKGEAVLTVL